MAEVSNNATRGDVLSSDKKSGAPAFDLRSWQGLTDVLRFAREAGLSDAAYGEFRNLVLGYAQSGGSADMRAKIDAQIALMTGGVRVSAHVDAPKGVVHSPVMENKQPVPAEVAPVPAPVEEVVSSGNAIPSSIKPPAFRRPAPSFMPKHVGTAIPEFSGSSPVIDTPPQVQESVPTRVAPEKVTPPAQPDEGFKTLDAYKARIAEIKRAINSEVGNPIMLVDSGVPVGREYMTALLTAMKAAGSGGQGLDEAMTALETAYVRVLDVVKAKRSEGVVSEQKNERETVSLPSMSPPEQVDTKEIPVGVAARLPDTTFQAPETPQAVSRDSINKAAVRESFVPELTSTDTEDADEDGLLEGRPAFASRATIPLVDTPLAATQNGLQVSPVEVMDIPVQSNQHVAIDASHEGNKYTEAGLGRAEFDPTIEPLESATSEVVTRQSELVSSEITTALSQLLHEWSLFASSGLFGIGPGGMDHPLYKKLAGLSMGEVLAGRFEGATPDLRRTLKDYVDAWRHEQGVAYNPTETFEHYLRRVVQRILKRQKGESPA